MNKYVSALLGWFGWGGALGDRAGKQTGAPTGSLVAGTASLHTDGALQISAVWACVDLLSRTIASLPLFVFEGSGGKRTLARESMLWQLLHDSPNRRMTPMEFWVAMLLNLMLRGNAYARIDRNANGDAISLWPMSADQVAVEVLDDGSVVYIYSIGNDRQVLGEQNVLHLKDLGNGTFGLSRLDYMRATTSELANAQTAANALFANGGKPTGVLMIDSVLNAEQRKAIKERFVGMAEGSASRLYVLEANMKYEQLSLTPQDTQLLETRKYGVEEIGRWFGVPAVLINHSNTTAWGSGIEQIIDGFFKFTVRPALVSIEQALRKRVLTPAQRARYSVEWNFDGLLRANIKDRMEVYAKAVQNGLKTRNECRQLENDPPIAGGDVLTAQVNLVPIDMLGKTKQAGTVAPDPVQQ
jgi:HK97 family phage portal protein